MQHTRDYENVFDCFHSFVPIFFLLSQFWTFSFGSARTHTHLHNKRIKTNIRVAWTYQHQKKTATTTFFIHWHLQKWAKVNKTNVNDITWSEWGYRRDGIISEKCSRKWNLTFKLVFPYYLLVVKRIIIFLCKSYFFSPLVFQTFPFCKMHVKFQRNAWFWCWWPKAQLLFSVQLWTIRSFIIINSFVGCFFNFSPE